MYNIYMYVYVAHIDPFHALWNRGTDTDKGLITPSQFV